MSLASTTSRKVGSVQGTACRPCVPNFEAPPAAMFPAATMNGILSENILSKYQVHLVTTMLSHLGKKIAMWHAKTLHRTQHVAINITAALPRPTPWSPLRLSRWQPCDPAVIIQVPVTAGRFGIAHVVPRPVEAELSPIPGGFHFVDGIQQLRITWMRRPPWLLLNNQPMGLGDAPSCATMARRP